jgi:hypothetical protein
MVCGYRMCGFRLYFEKLIVYKTNPKSKLKITHPYKKVAFFGTAKLRINRNDERFII